MKCLLIFLLTFGLVPVATFAQSSNLTCSGNEIWFSNPTPIEGQRIRMFAVLRNDSGYELHGEGEFLVNGEVVAEPEFYTITNHCISFWADWDVIPGDHQMTARSIDPNRVGLGQVETPLTGFEQSVTTTLVVELDNDGDGISNSNDPDDDNDGLLDTSEGSHGTDPFNYDTDRDGTNDGDEIRGGTDPLDRNSNPTNGEGGGNENQGINELLAQNGEGQNSQGAIQVGDGGDSSRSQVLVASDLSEETNEDSSPGFRAFFLNLRNSITGLFSNEESNQPNDNQEGEVLGEQVYADAGNPLLPMWIAFFLLLILGILTLMLGRRRERKREQA